MHSLRYSDSECCNSKYALEINCIMPHLEFITKTGQIMFPVLFLLFVGMPLLEILVLIQVGSVIGGLNTILLLVVTAVIGAALVRGQGMQAYQKAQQRMAMGEMPGIQLAEGILIFVAGLMFVTPGLITDVFAVLLLIPPVRQVLAKKMMARMQVQMSGGASFTSFGFRSSGQNSPFQQRPGSGPDNGRIFDGEYSEKEEERRRLERENSDRN